MPVENSRAQNAPGSFTLRPEQASDESFLFLVFASTRADEVALTGWPQAQQEQFLRMQFAAQRQAYGTQFPDAQRSVILNNGVDAGRVFVDRTPAEVHVVDIALLPEHRKQGLGSAIMNQLLAEAAIAGKQVRLYVERFNPALRWYESMGFKVSQESDIYLEMIWRVGPGKS